MSAGVLPLGTYHRATALGAGTYGSVVTVYDVDGNEFALKLFDEDDSEYEGSEEESYYEDDDNSSNNDDEDPCASLLDLGALREISILRLLRHDNAHPNIISIHDVKQAHDMDAEEDGDGDGIRKLHYVRKGLHGSVFSAESYYFLEVFAPLK